MMNHFRQTPLLIVTIAFLTSGCLSSSHRISKSELGKLAQIAPQVRGENVRVTQAFSTSSAPPRHDGVQNNTVVLADSPIWIGGRPHHHGHGTRGGGSASVRPRSAGKAGGISSGKGRSTGISSGKGSNNAAALNKDSAKALLVLAAAAAIALAATEGARYDGWVKLHPMYPVHLYGPYGEYLVLPLAQIDAPTAAWADHAIVVEGEGPWTKLRRAPLYRQGFTFSVFLGSGEIPVADFSDQDFTVDPGFTGHIQFGYFPTPELGLQLDVGMAWSVDDVGNTIYISRNSLELQAFPVKAGRLHGGIFGQLGFATRFDDGIRASDNSSLIGGGALLQLDITTRLALTGRVGITRAFGEESQELGIGLSIY